MSPTFNVFARLPPAPPPAADASPWPWLLEDDDDPAVFVVRGDKAARVPVKLGYYDGPWVEVRDGLKPGDRVVTAGKVALREGSKVQVIGDAAARPAVAAAKPAGKQP